MKSLNSHWFKCSKETIEKLTGGNVLERDCIFGGNGKYYRVLSVFKKLYGKWRDVRSGKCDQNVKVRIQI